MLYLIKKELTANVRYLLLGIAVFVVYALIFSTTSAALFTLCVILFFYFLSATNLVFDERYKIDLLLATLPVRRRDVVLSKYLLMLVVFITAAVLYSFLAVISRAAGYEKIPMLTLMSTSLAFCSLSIFNGLSIPLAYKYGAQSTRLVSFILFFALFFVSSLLRELKLPVLEAFSRPSDGYAGLLILAAGILISLLSFQISARIYEKKDL
jgi:hypothetical protein